MKPWLIGLASAVLFYTLPAPAQAQDSRRYAEREAETPGLAEFKGGCPGPSGWELLIMIPIALVLLPFYGLYKGAVKSLVRRNGQTVGRQTHGNLSIGGLSSFGVDGEGEIYMSDHDNSRIYKIEAM